MLGPLAARRVLGPLGEGGASAAASSLLNGLVAYWRMDEASGARADVGPNGLTLADNAGVTSTAGKIGTAASFLATSSQFLSSDSALLAVGDASFFISAWFWVDDTATRRRAQ